MRRTDGEPLLPALPGKVIVVLTEPPPDTVTGSVTLGTPAVVPSTEEVRRNPAAALLPGFRISSAATIFPELSRESCGTTTMFAGSGAIDRTLRTRKLSMATPQVWPGRISAQVPTAS